ncbi:DUF1328 domain-containing protein [Sphingomonas sp.]|uniref:DUF1328 domain-containing protein n=1 Tax=Sphingomonas sp. TaxID=28214 RepID=UPI003B00D91A
MIKWAIIFLVLGLVCGAFGFTGAEGTFVTIAKFLFVLALIVFVVLLVLGLLAGRAVSDRL